MSAFCAECGFALSQSASFCGGCGANVKNTCPTCGQLWPSEKGTKSGKSSITISSGAKSKKVSTSKVPPIYGPKYDSEYDCPNCGAKDQNYLVCKTCGEDNE